MCIRDRRHSVGTHRPVLPQKHDKAGGKQCFLRLYRIFFLEPGAKKAGYQMCIRDRSSLPSPPSCPPLFFAAVQKCPGSPICAALLFTLRHGRPRGRTVPPPARTAPPLDSLCRIRYNRPARFRPQRACPAGRMRKANSATVLTPVSYTHLDGYKRQPLRAAAVCRSARRRSIGRCSPRAACPLRRGPRACAFAAR